MPRFRAHATRPAGRSPRSVIAPVSRRLLRGLTMMAIASATQACGAPARASTADEAAAAVDSLYRDHFAHEQNFDGTYQRQRARFAPELAALLDADARAAAANPDEIVGLDFDPLTWAQDTMTGYEVSPSTRDGADAVVPVSVRQDTSRTSLRVRLSRPAGGGWRVSNLHYPEGDLVSILRQLAADRQRPPSP